MQARATASRGQRFFTNHESRNTAFFLRGARRVAPPETAVRTTAPAGKPLFSCSPLFTIVRHCSAKILPCASALAPPGRCFPARCGAAWGGYGAAWAAAVPRAGNTACKVFTNHETRDMAFMLFTRQESRNMVSPCPSGGSKERSPKPDQRVFTNHESRLLRFSSHDFPAFPSPPPGKGSASRSVAAFLRVVARHGAAMARHGRRPHRQQALLGFHQPRDTQHGFSLFLRRLQGEQPQARPTLFHESRVTNHGLYAFLPTISHYFPAFPAILRVPPPPGTGVCAPSAVALRTPSAEADSQ